MKKRWLTVLTCLLLVVCVAGLAACNNGGGNEGGTDVGGGEVGGGDIGGGEEPEDPTIPEEPIVTEALSFALSESGDYYIVDGIGKLSGDVAVPETYEGKPVKEIAAGAFANETELTAIIVPNSVETMGAAAFAGCANLKKISLPFTGATQDGAVDTRFCYLFGNDYKAVPRSLTSVKITGGTKIADSAFYFCNMLTEATIGEGVTEIGEKAFEYCTALERVNLPDSLKTIGWLGFDRCRALTDCALPEGLLTIANEAFYGCSALKSVKIPNTAASVGAGAFQDCTALSSVTVGTGIDQIDASVFRGCKALESIELPDNIKSIQDFAFDNCTALKRISIPAAAESVGGSALKGCSLLERIEFGGTTAQWTSLRKNFMWNSGTGNYTVVCSDGTLAK